MGKKSNVNPNHYKTRGRERQGDDIVQEIHKRDYAQANSASAKAGMPNFLPGVAPVAERGSNEDVKAAPGLVNDSANSSSNI